VLLRFRPTRQPWGGLQPPFQQCKNIAGGGKGTFWREQTTLSEITRGKRLADPRFPPPWSVEEQARVLCRRQTGRPTTNSR